MNLRLQNQINQIGEKGASPDRGAFLFIMIKTPNNLVKGDLVGIIPPANAIDFHFVNQAVKILETWGLQVILSGNIKDKFYQFAGNDQVRLRSFQDLLDSKEIKCILCARGGYGTTRIIDSLNFDKFRENPKWIVGYSDITALLLHLLEIGYQGIHGPMPINFSDPDAEESLERLRKILFEGHIEPIYIGSNLHNIEGDAQGRIIGGNLSMLVNSLGTMDDFSTDQQILFIEEVDEYLYRIDRMLIQLKRSGKLENLAGMVLGHFTRVKENEEPFGSGLEEIFFELTKDYEYPVCFGAPIGHVMPNFPIVIGQKYRLQVHKKEVLLSASEN